MNGSSGQTVGMVIGAEWRYGGGKGGGGGYKCDFHVLDGLSCDVVLSSELIFATNAFKEFQDCFHTIEDEKKDADVGLIKHKAKMKKQEGMYSETLSRAHNSKQCTY